jgi:DedD protein
VDESLKRRLVGATVLVSLIVIFVPMLLEEQSGEPPGIEGTNIPRRPEIDSGLSSSRLLPLEDEPLSEPPQVPELPEPETPTARTDTDGSDWPSDLPEQPAPGWGAETQAPPPVQETAGAQPVPESPVSLLAEPEEPEPPPAVKRVAPEPPEPAPAQAEPKSQKPAPAAAADGPSAAARQGPGSAGAGIQAWVVQVGSFADRNNADKLVEELRVARFPAFQEETRVNGQTVYRVRVGPEADRELVDAIAAGIAKRFQLKGQVVRYP